MGATYGYINENMLRWTSSNSKLLMKHPSTTFLKFLNNLNNTEHILKDKNIFITLTNMVFEIKAHMRLWAYVYAYVCMCADVQSAAWLCEFAFEFCI